MTNSNTNACGFDATCGVYRKTAKKTTSNSSKKKDSKDRRKKFYKAKELLSGENYQLFEKMRLIIEALYSRKPDISDDDVWLCVFSEIDLSLEELREIINCMPEHEMKVFRNYLDKFENLYQEENIKGKRSSPILSTSAKDRFSDIEGNKRKEQPQKFSYHEDIEG